MRAPKIRGPVVHFWDKRSSADDHMELTLATTQSLDHRHMVVYTRAVLFEHFLGLNRGGLEFNSYLTGRRGTSKDQSWHQSVYPDMKQ